MAEGKELVGESADVRDLLMKLLEELAGSPVSAAKRLGGEGLSRDVSDWNHKKRPLTVAKFNKIRDEILEPRRKAISDAKWAELHDAFERHRAAEERRRQQHIPGSIRALKPSEAFAVLERRVGDAKLDVAALTDPEGARRFVEAEVLNRMRDGRYDLAQSAGNALIKVMKSKYGSFSSVGEEHQWETIADASFYLGLNAFHAGADSTLASSIAWLAEADKERVSRSIRGNHIHMRNLYGRRGFGTEDARLAYETMLDTPITSLLRPRWIIERAIRARHVRQSFVVPRVPLTTVVMEGRTVEEQLEFNIETARESGAMDSFVIAHVTLVEAMLHYREGTRDATERSRLLGRAHEWLGRICTAIEKPGARTPNTEARQREATALVAKAESTT